MNIRNQSGTRTVDKDTYFDELLSITKGTDSVAYRVVLLNQMKFVDEDRFDVLRKNREI